ncbi:MAG: InlB B-repeat-containing protein [Bacilli bacterium]|nr:InlB B-repeat-containing protein [Bacilli bacterium]
MKIVRRIIVFLFVLVCAFFAFANLNRASADPVTTSSEIQVLGAGVRTAGNAGIRFVGSVGEYTNPSDPVISYGIAIAYGEVAVSDSFVKDGTLGGKEILSAEDTELDESGYYYVVLYNIPEDSYLQDVTARAYVVLESGNIIYGDSVITRNLAEVAIEAKNDGFSGGLIDTVVGNIEDNYMIATTTLNKEFVISKPNTKDYSFSDLSDLWAEFIDDFNAATTSTLTTESTATQFYNQMKTEVTANSQRDIPLNGNAVKFFSGANMVKWGWLLEYFSANGANSHVKNQATGLLREDRTCQTYGCYYFAHLTGSIWNFFNSDNVEVSGYGSNNFSAGESAYSKVTWPSAVDTEDLIKVGENINLPAATTPNVGYLFSCYKADETSYDALSSITISSTETSYVPTYEAIVYNINLYNGEILLDIEPKTYTIETGGVLPVLEDTATHYFAGWCTNSAGTGDIVSVINVGEYGNVTLYAAWNAKVSLDLHVNNDDVRLLNMFTNALIVDSAITPGSYTLDNENLDSAYDDKVFVYGENIFSNIGAAIGQVAENGIIYVRAGTYSSDFTADVDGVKIIGPNYNIAGTSLSRVAEAIISGITTITADGVEFNGFDNSTSGRILISGDNTLISCLTSTLATARNNDYITYNANISNLIVEKVKAVFSNGARFVTDSSSSVRLTNGTVRDCYAQGYIYSSSNKYTDGIRFQIVTGTFNIINNTIIGFDQYPIFFGAGTNNASQLNIINNSFSQGGKSVATITIRKTPASLHTNISYNTFENCKGARIIDYRGTISADCHTVSYNKFLDEIGTPVTYYLTNNDAPSTALPIVVDHNYFATTPTASSVLTSLSITNSYANANDVPEYVEE